MLNAKKQERKKSGLINFRFIMVRSRYEFQGWGLPLVNHFFLLTLFFILFCTTNYSVTTKKKISCNEYEQYKLQVTKKITKIVQKMK